MGTGVVCLCKYQFIMARQVSVIGNVVFVVKLKNAQGIPYYENHMSILWEIQDEENHNPWLGLSGFEKSQMKKYFLKKTTIMEISF